jgi:hypothetical protein
MYFGSVAKARKTGNSLLDCARASPSGRKHWTPPMDIFLTMQLFLSRNPSKQKVSAGGDPFARSHSETTIKDIHSIIEYKTTRIICIPPLYNLERIL